MSVIRVTDCGPGSMLQDLGRIGQRRFGISTAGAMDRASLAIANALVGNPVGEAAVEFTMRGGTFMIEEGPVVVALGGAARLSIDGQVVPAGQSVHAESGTRLDVGPVRGAIHAYLSVAGGFDVPCEMGSRSVHQRSGIGGRSLQPGDRLARRTTTLPPPMFLNLPRQPQDEPIRIVPGPQDDYFADDGLKQLQERDFTKGARSDRMGIFLEGPTPELAQRESMVSDGVLPGSIQVPSDRELIVLMRDCQSTGGYPKIATVISADLDRLAQIPPGGTVRFRRVTVQQALQAAREQHERLHALLSTLGPVVDLLGSERLLSLNLVDGMIDAHHPRV